MVYRRIECIWTHQCNCTALDIMAAVPGGGGLRSTREGCMAARAMVRMLSSTTSAPGVMSSCGVVTVWVCAAGTAGATSGMRTRAERGTVAVRRGWQQWHVEGRCEGDTEMGPLVIVYRDSLRQGRAEQIQHTDTVVILSSITYTWERGDREHT